MTRYKIIKSLDIETLAELFCELYPRCDSCPLVTKCNDEINGFLNWLEEDITIIERR